MKDISKEIITGKILEILSFCKDFEETLEGGITFLEIAKKIPIDLKKKKDWWKLKAHLLEMEKEGLIEERHFEDGRVDYSIENKGIKILASQALSF